MTKASSLLTLGKRYVLQPSTPLTTTTIPGVTGSGTQSYPLAVNNLSISYLGSPPTMSVVSNGVIHYSWNSVTADTTFALYIIRSYYTLVATNNGVEWTDTQQVQLGALSGTFSVLAGDVVRIGYPGDQTDIAGFSIYWTAS